MPTEKSVGELRRRTKVPTLFLIFVFEEKAQTFIFSRLCLIVITILLLLSP